MATRTVSTADAREEGLGAELTPGLRFRVKRALARAPQDVRYVGSRFHGIDVPKMSETELMAEMGISRAEFRDLLRRADLCIAPVLRRG